MLDINPALKEYLVGLRDKEGLYMFITYRAQYWVVQVRY